jgi:hypothetical protein
VTKRKPCPVAHHWLVTFVNGVEHGVCQKCHAYRDFYPDRARLEGLKHNAVSK